MTDWPVIVIRFALFICLALLFGLPLFRWHAMDSVGRAELPQHAAARSVVLLAITAIALAASGVWLNCARMAGVAIIALDRPTAEMIITQTPVGTAWQVQMGALALALVAALWSRRSRSLWASAVLAIAAGVALASLAWTGHGTAGEGVIGTAHLISDVGHLLAVGAWLGALAGFVGLLFGRGSAASPRHLTIAAQALHRFAITGSVAVGLIVLSGVVNSAMLLDLTHPQAVISSLYGQLLGAKLALFLGMFVIAGANRLVLTPALTEAIARGDTRSAIVNLRRSLALESSAAVAIIALVAWLGTLEPPSPIG